MDPSKRARVETQLGEWLRYGDDLGLGPFYRDRAPSSTATVSAAAPVTVSSELPTEVIVHTIRTEETIEMPTSRTPAKAFPASLTASGAPVSAPASVVLPIVNDSNLFDSFERVANDSLRESARTSAIANAANFTKGAPSSSSASAIRRRS